MIALLIFLGTSFLVSLRLKNKFARYAKVPLVNGMSGY